MEQTTRTVFIDGEAGTTGLGIRERLADLPGIALRSLPDAHRKDAIARRDMMAEVDLVVLCLPDDAARDAVAIADGLGEDAPRLLDASTAHRTAVGWTYGFPEMTPDQPKAIARAARVANPGCYPTGAIALLRPLVDAGLLAADHPVTINAVSGYSGGGKAAIATHESDGGPAFELYALALEHKHVSETERYARLTRRPIFVPSVAHVRQGMLVSVPLHLDMLPHAPTGADLHAALLARYRHAKMVTVADRDDCRSLTMDDVVDTDQLELRVFAHDQHRHAVLVARLDNLGKGASGAAVQNIRLMLGLDAVRQTPVRVKVANG